ncbi:MAG: DinB family protein [Salinibacter sp.]|uniref:DinB family protein n=1 Tax=Salinibacter sp. TaxID=2065818 RepID=UPI0035D4EC63
MSTSESLAVDPATELEALETFYDDTGAYLDELADDALFEPVPTVSEWSPAQHLYHIWRANASMLKAANVLADGRIETQTPDLSEDGEQALREGSIPRRGAEAPNNMHPPDDLDRDGLRETWTRSCGKLDDVASRVDAIADADGGLPHPFWGTLTAAEWLRAAHVHSNHHSTIVTDILAGR